jgi:hypothetical protein
MRYVKDTPRIAVKYINEDTEETIYEINDRTWMNLGEVVTDYFVENLFQTELKSKKRPKNLMVLCVTKFKLQ